MQAEKAVEKYLCRRVKEFGGMCVKLVGYNGIPDRLIILPDGRHVFVEVKTDGGRVAPIQAAIHRRLREMMHDVRVVWDFKQVDSLMEEL